MRGVHVKKKQIWLCEAGSSPHARGPHKDYVASICLHRIIPACAGSTVRPVYRHGKSWDHPRMRGVHFQNLVRNDFTLGSSPHARGPLKVMPNEQTVIRIIPACAGSTSPIFTIVFLIKDHPRMRGVHSGVGQSKLFAQGSSPHARGPPYSNERYELVSRIIPACAGSTIPESCQAQSA